MERFNLVLLKKYDEKEYIESLIQDMKVHARDMDDFVEGMKYKKIIGKLEKGVEEEYKKEY